MYAPTHKNPYILNYYNSTIMSTIELVINDLKSQKALNITATVKKYKVNHYTLLRCFRGKIGSKVNRIEIKSLLNKQQKKTLINKINRLSAFSTPPTVTMVCVFALNFTGIWSGIN